MDPISRGEERSSRRTGGVEGSNENQTESMARANPAAVRLHSRLKQRRSLRWDGEVESTEMKGEAQRGPIDHKKGRRFAG